MRKLLVSLVCGVLFISVWGCSSGGSTEAQPENPPEIQEEGVPPVGE